MPIRAIIVAGEKYFRLTVIKEVKAVKFTCVGGLLYPLRRVKCVCECGNMVTTELAYIKSGNNKSCGCLKYENLEKSRVTHGLSKHPLYWIWGGMIARCYNKNERPYKDYGGRGISVCKEWRNNFKIFYDWCISNGWRRGLDIDRFPNNDGNYEPSNCRFATRKMGNNNTRANVFYSYNEKQMTLPQICDELGLNYKRTYQRVNKLGWSLSDAIQNKKNERQN